MTGLQPTTLAHAGPVMAKNLGLSWLDDRLAVVGYINKFRELLFLNYPEDNQFSNIFHCICVSKFNEPCVRGTCITGSPYWGFSLPRDVEAVEAIFTYGYPQVVRSRWRETLDGIPSGCGGQTDATEMARQFPTERDMDAISALKVRGEHRDDAGKKLFIQVIDADWKEQTLEFTFEADGWAVVPTLVREILSVALPVDRVGGVTVAQAEGRELSFYQPWETVPAYRRFKLPRTCPTTAVVVQGVKRFYPIWWGHDIVEVGSSIVIEHAAKYFKYGENTTDTKEIKTAEYHLAKMKEAVAGLIARSRGHATMDGTPFRGRITKSTRLPGVG